MKRLSIRLVSLTCALVMLLGLLLACSPSGTIQPTGGVQPTGGTAQTTTAVVPPAQGKVYQWRWQSSSSAGDALYWAQQQMLDDMKIASGGRLDFKLFPQGAIVARTEAFDAVSSGAIEAAPSASENDWGGKDMKFEIGNIPAGMEAFVMWCWENYTTKDDPVPPGEKLLAGLYAKYNIKAFNVSVSTPEVEYLANKPIQKPADYKGLTFRGAGWELDVISRPEFGAKPVFIPSSDIYSSLQTGVIDAFESSNPNSNFISGYADITKFWGFPGMHNLSQTGHMMINMDKWKELPADLQKIIELAANMQESRVVSFSMVESAKRFPELAKKGITMIYEDKDVQLLWRNMMLKTAEERRAKDPEFGKELDKALEFQYLLDAYIDLQHPVYDATYPGKKENVPGFPKPK